MKKCGKCLKKFDRSNFYKNSGKKDKLSWACKSCERKIRKKRRQENLEQEKKKQREYYRKNAKQAKENRKKFTKKYSEKSCSTCGDVLKLECFYSNPGQKTGYSSVCKKCHSKAGKEYRKRPEVIKKNKKKSKEWYENNKEKIKDWELQNKYGITIEQYNIMIKSQDNKCIICEKEDKLFVDHNHDTGKVRGLLCHFCNAGLGCFRDNINNLKQAIKYIEERNHVNDRDKDN